MKNRKTAIVCNGDINDYNRFAREILNYDTIIAADGGSDHLKRIDLAPHLLIGDRDSIKEPVNRKTTVIPYPEDKDKSDMDLAIRHAILQSSSIIDIFGAMGGRHDHQFCNIMVLTNYSEPVTIITENSSIRCIQEGSTAEIIKKTETDNIITIMPVDRVVEITTRGLMYQLEKQELERGSRGLSNIMTGDRAVVTVHAGTIILFHSWHIEQRRCDG